MSEPADIAGAVRKAVEAATAEAKAKPLTLPADEYAAVHDVGERLGRIVRAAWVDCVRKLIPDPKPSWVAPWEELDGFQRTADICIGLAVAADVAARADAAQARLDEIRQVIDTYFVVHGNSTAATLTHARDLAEGIRQILDREERHG